MLTSSTELLKMAVEIAKAYAASSAHKDIPIEDVMEAAYKKLKELNES